MGVFSRIRDIVNSNLNSMLEKAEDPKKLIQMMIAEMEDTLVEVKAAAAGVMATSRRIERDLDNSRVRVQQWRDKAKLALDKGREDLAREALREKQYYLKQVEALERELTEFEVLIEQYKHDLRQLEDKLAEAREKHRVLVQRHIHAWGKKRVQNQIYKADSTDAFVRFEQLEHRVERMEAEAELFDFGRKVGLADQFQALEDEESIEKELKELRGVAKPPAVPAEKPAMK